MYRQADAAGSFDDGIAEVLVIHFGGEDRLPVVAALDDVLRLAGDDVAGQAGHGGLLGWAGDGSLALSVKWCLTPFISFMQQDSIQMDPGAAGHGGISHSFIKRATTLTDVRLE